jgi:hypothetical protein
MDDKLNHLRTETRLINSVNTMHLTIIAGAQTGPWIISLDDGKAVIDWKVFGFADPVQAVSYILGWVKTHPKTDPDENIIRTMVQNINDQVSQMYRTHTRTVRLSKDMIMIVRVIPFIPAGNIWRLDIFSKIPNNIIQVGTKTNSSTPILDMCKWVVISSGLNDPAKEAVLTVLSKAITDLEKQIK